MNWYGRSLAGACIAALSLLCAVVAPAQAQNYPTRSITMERILGGSEKLVYDGGSSGSQSIVPYLPLSELTPRRPPAPATTGQQQPQAGGTR